ncbi:MAG: hypothetical protein MPJ24_04330 [Pirellulaceae bacterium]|nr:hypothetical protein [Pirellulaceae bacterium]
MKGEHIDISNEAPLGEENIPKGTSKGRRYVGIKFECCSVYQRIYINQSETAYEGQCPRCLKKLRLRIGPGGTDQRIFTAK